MTVGGRPASKPATLVAPDESVAVADTGPAFVSRGGRKLDAALAAFGVDPAGRRCLDAGASTGGFTDRLLQGGAQAVIAVDVGYGQLAWELRNDPRVTVLERTNVRDLQAEAMPFRPDLVVADLSFISLRTALPGLMSVADDDAEFVLLVKPQFEAGRRHVGKGGVVRDPAVWRLVLDDVVGACVAQGIGVRDVLPSPILGPAGNAEFFVYARRGREPLELDLDGAIRDAEHLRTAP